MEECPRSSPCVGDRDPCMILHRSWLVTMRGDCESCALLTPEKRAGKLCGLAERSSTLYYGHG